MRGLYQILMPLLGLFLVRVDLTDLFPMKIPVEVLKIYDGDTILVRHKSFRFKVRLSKIDAPEKFQGKSGMISKQCLEKVLKNQSRILIIEKQDIYGRILGELDGLSLKLIEQGCSPLYPHAEFRNQREKFEYLRALKIAKAARSGLWQYDGFVQPKKWRKINKQSLRRQWRQQDHSQRPYHPGRKFEEKGG
jgi:endonuclease YncB( thermonuclease family)